MALAPLEIRGHTFDWSRGYLVGVLNTTPDSFSDGGLYDGLERAIAHARALQGHGADVIDIGGEATRPGAEPVSVGDEIARTVPVIERLRAQGCELPLAIDTSKAEVAAAALAAGVDMVNDISGGRFEPDIVEVVRRAEAVFICGHLRGGDIAEVHASETEPPSAQEVCFELAERVARLPLAVRRRTIVDPGLGFGKPPLVNAELVRWSGQISRATGCPIMVGPSRKRFVRALAQVPGAAPASSSVDAGTVGASLAALAHGAHFLRVHNIELLRPAVMVYQGIVDDLR